MKFTDRQIETLVERVGQQWDKRKYYRELVTRTSTCSDMLGTLAPSDVEAVLMDITLSALDELERRGHEWLLQDHD